MRHVLLAGMIGGWLATFGAAQAEEIDVATVLRAHDIPVTGGATPGYVPDAECSACHINEARGYAEMGMAQSFYRPGAEKVIEDFAALPVYHAPSDRYYEVRLQGDDYVFRRFRKATDGSVIDAWQVRIDWIMGSGNHSRVYMFQTDDGALFELPLAWYSQDGRWDMAPGYEFADHPGLSRQVRHRCMFCHNGFAELPAEAGIDGMPELFPAEMPEGIGCQRCHGPGAQHVGLALAGTRDYAALVGSIVDTGRLTPKQQNSLCYSCHMQPSVAVASPLRLGRRAYDFRPGQDISDYLARLDVTDAHRAPDARFDINHHAYRLEQSRCFIESAPGDIGCTSCHDPHRKVAPENRAAHYRQACLQCHETGDDGVPVMAAGAHPQIEADADCTKCHMVNRRPQDVINVVMTDHRISRDAGPGNPTARLEKLLPDVQRIHLADPDQTLPKDEAAVYEMMAGLDFTLFRSEPAADALGLVLSRGDYSDPAPWLSLANAEYRRGDYAAAARAARMALQHSPDNAEARLVLARAMFRAGNRDGGIAQLQDALTDRRNLADARYNLAAMYRMVGALDKAEAEARATLALQHNHLRAQFILAEIAEHRGDLAQAAEGYRAVLAIAPHQQRSRAALVRVLEALGTADAALHRAELERGED